MQELPHRGLLVLSPGGKPQRLLNRGTGEVVNLPDRNGNMFQLCFCPDGYGVLAPSDGQAPHWASELFRFALATTDQGGQLQYVIFDKQLDVCTSLAEARATYTKGGYYHRTSGGFLFECEVYLYRSRWPFADQVFWTLPYFQQAVVGQQKRQNWISEHRVSIVAALESLGYEPDHLQLSSKALRASSKDDALTPDDTSAGQEFVVSTTGIFMMLLHWPRSRLKGASGESGQNCYNILENVVDRARLDFVGEATLVLRDFNEVEICATMHHNDIIIPECELPASGRSFWKGFLRRHGVGGKIGAANFASELYLVTRTTSRWSQASISCAPLALRALIDLLASLYDLSKDDARWTERMLAVSPLKGQKRMRRVSSGLKVALLEVATKTAGVKLPSHITVGSGIILAAKGEEHNQLALSTNYVKEYMWQYLCTSRKIHQGRATDRLALCFDGCRAAGEETMVILGVAPDIGAAGVLPPQVSPESPPTRERVPASHAQARATSCMRILATRCAPASPNIGDRGRGCLARSAHTWALGHEVRSLRGSSALIIRSHTAAGAVGQASSGHRMCPPSAAKRRAALRRAGRADACVGLVCRAFMELRAERLVRQCARHVSSLRRRAY